MPRKGFGAIMGLKKHLPERLPHWWLSDQMKSPDQFIPLNHTAFKQQEFLDPEGPWDPQDKPDHKDFPDPVVKPENPGNRASQATVDFQDPWDHQDLTAMMV